jgi:glycosyltransferase involved in cell wall biosynthesis
VNVAVVADGYDDVWNERHLVARRLAGALACSAAVDVLVPAQRRCESDHDGAVRVLRFPATAVDPARRLAWRTAVLGERLPDDPLDCRCLTASRRTPLPDLAEEELVRAEGGDSPELYRHLREAAYDLVVFVGFHSPVTCWGVRSVPEGRRVVLAPAAGPDRTLWLRIHQEVFDRAESIIVCTETERATMVERLGQSWANRIENLGFVVGVNYLARSTEPHDFEDKRYVVMAQKWDKAPSEERIRRWAKGLRELGDDIELCLVGPGAEQRALGVRLTTSRVDVWRWVSRATALLDPRPHQLIGTGVLEALLFGTPVVVSAHGGASREHAEHGNGGLWYRTDDELFACVATLLDRSVARALGERGRHYAEETYADTDVYIKRVAASLLT